MANTYTQFMYHFVFSVKTRTPSISIDRERELYGYIHGIHEKLGVHTYRIGGDKEHIHVLNSLPSTLAPAKYLEKMKSATTNWIRKNAVFDAWPGWQDGYGGFTESWDRKDELIEYIRNQKEHHKHEDFLTEYRRLLEERGIKYDERYL